MSDRELTSEEKKLVEWMLKNGKPEAEKFLPQIEHLQVTPFRCDCGCASIEFSFDGKKPELGMKPIAEFIYGDNKDLSGIFVYEVKGVLGGIENYRILGDNVKTLPTPDILRTGKEDI